MNSGKASSDMWEEIVYDENLVKNALSLAERDLHTAKTVLDDGDFDWAFSISYNAMLQAGRALMFSRGLRPKGEHRHVSVVEFVKSTYGGEFDEKALFLFDKIRKKRHTAVYEQVNVISETEAKTALKCATEFTEIVKGIIGKNSLR
jgi:uncharacterized protein (UPF0332 family)